MSDKTWWETVELKGDQLLKKIQALVDEGNVRRVRVRQKDRVVAEFPLTLGVVGAVLAPVAAAVGALAALLAEYTIEVERTAPTSATAEVPPSEHPASADRGPT